MHTYVWSLGQKTCPHFNCVLIATNKQTVVASLAISEGLGRITSDAIKGVAHTTAHFSSIHFVVGVLLRGGKEKLYR